MSKVYNVEIMKEISNRTGMPLTDVKKMFGVYTEVLQEKITEAKTGDIVELAGGVGSLTVSLAKSRRYKSFESNDAEDVFVETECKRRAKLNTYSKTKQNINVKKPEYGITDKDTLAYISQHRMSSKYTVKRVEVVKVQENQVEPLTQTTVKKHKLLKNIFNSFSKKTTIVTT